MVDNARSNSLRDSLHGCLQTVDPNLDHYETPNPSCTLDFDPSPDAQSAANDVALAVLLLVNVGDRPLLHHLVSDERCADRP